MKKVLIFLIVIGMITGIYSCQKTFLQKPNTSGTANLTTVYSSSVNAISALLQCYRGALIQGWPGGIGFGHGALADISGEQSRGYSWHGTYAIANVGLTPNALDGGDSGGADNFGANFTNIRADFLVSENIDQVPDMDAANKTYVKAEVAGLVAYRYMGMFIRYGGVPIVTKSFLPTDNLTVPRSTLQQTLDYTLQLCETAINGLPDKWSANSTGGDQTGRLTKGATLAIKAKVLMYAARPLFNAATPYLPFAHSDLICFGTYDPAKWQTAITANEAVLTWAAANGYYLINTGGGTNVPNKNALDDYGTATSTPNNPEVILAYKNDNANQSDGGASGKWFNFSPYWTSNRYDTDNNGLLSNFLPNYYKADGTDQIWPQVGDGLHPGSEYLSKIASMEPRFLADHMGPGFDAANNPGDNKWSDNGWGRGVVNNNVYPNPAEGAGDAQSTKFYYHAGSRIWFEFPLFRLAETYLNLAEAYNEVGNTTKALQNLNMVHNRAGLPSITETNQARLRTIIQREWAVEFYNESHRYYDVKHWKLPAGNGIMGGPIRQFVFQFPNNNTAKPSNINLASSILTTQYFDAVSYTAYWADKMYLEPFPLTEVNKLIILQNPGY
ncbi:MAG: RagB/SusD domain protein [Mucilaginibacter sp.]|nr:RagB/SusD domain protein [Mucilaginibacter sp.]